MTTTPTVTISGRGEERLRSGHPWIYRADLRDAQAAGGDVVRLLAPRGRPVGFAFYSDRSEIALRVLSRGATLDPAWCEQRLRAAIAYRTTLSIDASAYRLVHGEADRLPSLVVDRYGDYLVLQALSQATDRRQAQVASILVELLAPRGLLARNDPRVRELEGLERRVESLWGEVPPTITVREGPVVCEVDPWHGQKTGGFLDQRENREAAAAYARGRLLDCFSYTGAFALRLAARCADVLALDSSEAATAAVVRDAKRNGLTTVRSETVNVFEALRQLDRSGARFDTIVLDPPAFAKHRSAVAKALGGYKEINLRALKLLAPGGHLITCSCSYHVDDATFSQVVHAAAVDARAVVTVVERRTQARDHPVVLGIPETCYLKCLILRKLP